MKLIITFFLILFASAGFAQSGLKPVTYDTMKAVIVIRDTVINKEFAVQGFIVHKQDGADSLHSFEALDSRKKHFPARVKVVSYKTLDPLQKLIS